MSIENHTKFNKFFTHFSNSYGITSKFVKKNKKVRKKKLQDQFFFVVY